jgi:hypothetical protein
MSLIFGALAPLAIYGDVLIGVTGVSLIVSAVVIFWSSTYLSIWAMA